MIRRMLPDSCMAELNESLHGMDARGQLWDRPRTLHLPFESLCRPPEDGTPQTI